MVKWEERYGVLQINWHEFYEDFLHRFCGTQGDAELLDELYGQTQWQKLKELLLLRKTK